MQILGNQTGTAILLAVADLPEYIDGKSTGNIIGQKYHIVATDNGYEKLIVKVKGAKPIITNEQIQQKGGQVKITIKGLSGRFYRNNNGELALSCSADSVEVI